MYRRLSLVLLTVGCIAWVGFDRAGASPGVEGTARGQAANRKTWRVPTRKARLASPVPRSDAALAAGKGVYARECASCHGADGRGDGPSAVEIESGVPAFQESNLAAQSDGALFYKILTGRDPMPGYRKLLGEEEIWQVVLHLRVLAPPPLTEPRYQATAEQREGVSSVLAHCAATTGALASGDAARASSSASELARASGVLVGAPGISDDQRATWLADLAALEAAARGLASAEALTDQRALYADLSDAMCLLVDDFGHAEPEPLRLVQRSERSKTWTWLELEGASKDPYASEGESPRTIRRLAGRPASEPQERSESTKE